MDVKAPSWYKYDSDEPGREGILPVYELERVLEVCHSFFILFYFFMNRSWWIRSGDLIFQAA